MNDFDDYQQEAMKTAEYPNIGGNVVYPAMGLSGEAGEACDKIKKYWRKTNNMSGKRLTPDQRCEFAKELGDVLWYIAACANEVDLYLSDIAEINLDKLRDRRERGVIKGEGDNR